MIPARTRAFKVGERVRFTDPTAAAENCGESTGTVTSVYPGRLPVEAAYSVSGDTTHHHFLVRHQDLLPLDAPQS